MYVQHGILDSRKKISIAATLVQYLINFFKLGYSRPRPLYVELVYYLMVNLGPVGVDEDEESEAKGQDEEAVPDGQPQDGLCGGG